jgi:4-hydroxybenzoate polyprenyltransferase
MVASVPPLAWVLLLGNLFWVLAYDTEYAMVDRDDDLRIGIKTSAITLGRLDVVAILLFYATYLAIWGAVILGRTTAPLALVSAGPRGGGAQAAWHGWLIRDRTRDGCFKAFRLNHWLGFAVFAGIAGAYSLALSAAQAAPNSWPSSGRGRGPRAARAQQPP